MQCRFFIFENRLALCDLDFPDEGFDAAVRDTLARDRHRRWQYVAAEIDADARRQYERAGEKKNKVYDWDSVRPLLTEIQPLPL